jgi:hypothetical protein
MEYRNNEILVVHLNNQERKSIKGRQVFSPNLKTGREREEGAEEGIMIYIIYRRAENYKC